MMRKALKGSLAAAAGIALGLGTASMALAQDGEGEEPIPVASGTVSSENGVGLYGSIGEAEKNVEASMLSIELGEGDARTVYCIQIQVGLLKNSVHEERAWEEVPVEDLPLVLGVLLNGYNGGNATELIEAAGVTDADLGDFSADQVAYAGTQAAVWSLTDGWTINAEDPTQGGDGVDAAVTGVQTYLLENSEPAEEPEMDPYFEVDDSEAAVDGTTVGPFTVSTNLGTVTFQQPEGATIVDENGEAVTEFSDGQSVWVEFDEAQSSTVNITTESVIWTTPVGRVFVPVDASSETLTGQNLILGQSHEEEIAAEVEFELVIEDVPSESPSAQPQLPVTGTSLTTVAGIGGAVLVAGVAAIVLMRRRAATAGGDWGDDK
ncbi:Cys-Gln thioester bond-forming surface protein [Glycomyces tarimensis]